MQIRWNSDKNRLLIETRRVSFEDVQVQMANGGVLDDFAHPNSDKYPNQRVLVVALNGYPHLVPYVFEDDGGVFWKTIIPSRKALKALGEAISNDRS